MDFVSTNICDGVAAVRFCRSDGFNTLTEQVPGVLCSKQATLATANALAYATTFMDGDQLMMSVAGEEFQLKVNIINIKQDDK